MSLREVEIFIWAMVWGEWAYQAAHIPGSLHINRITEGFRALSKDDKIDAYCSDLTGFTSVATYNYLTDDGYE